MKDLNTFTLSLDAPEPPPHLDRELLALWWAGKSEWSKAHAQVDTASGTDAAWVHAYLHRWEGDMDNAGYWYQRAGRPLPAQSLDEEWQRITQSLIERH
ncbi:hypothetical protein [Salinicola aestuarinus]|uniref:hypothetical protein n=1 Tax=Salinicola aestuarinus TaxID=1949082 RepID=UPI000DA1B995|nr:hypothetical protein [Salinicola aestuarinus]